MKKRLTLLTVLVSFGMISLNAQNVGIGVPTPSGKLDIVQTETTGPSAEINHDITSNGSSAVWIRNSGTSRALHAQNLSTTSNTHVARFLQLGNGVNAHGVLIDMDAATVAGSIGNFINNAGRGFGQYIILNNAANTSDGATVDHYGSGASMSLYQLGTGRGIYNDVAASIGLTNVIRANSIGVASLLTTAGGTGELIDLATRNGTGVYVIGVDNTTTPTAGGNVYSFFTSIRTLTPTAGTTVYGAAVAANQYGVGHGILINHSGTQGRNAEFNVNGATNTDAAIFSIHRGRGSAVLGQNQNNTLPSAIRVADFSYTGTDAKDHIGVRGFSSPAAGWGIGVQGVGGYFGVHGFESPGINNNMAAYGLFATGDMGASGTKYFVTDHPLDPANKYLRHACIESPEILNMYRGNAQLDANGKATIELPSYFEAINIDFSYQLTAIGTPQQPYIAQEIEAGRFEIAGAPNSKVSWTVYAKRNDLYIQKNPEVSRMEFEKEPNHKGKYLMPELFNQPEELRIGFSPEPENTIQATNIELPSTTLEGIKGLEKEQNKVKPARQVPQPITGVEDVKGTK